MSETGFIVIYVGRAATSPSGDYRPIPYNIGDRLIVTKVTISDITGITYYEVTDGKTTSGGWYDASLFKRLDDMREGLEEIGI